MADNMLGFMKRIGALVIAGFYTQIASRNLITIGEPVDSGFGDVGQTVGFRVKPSYSATRFQKGDSQTAATEISPQVESLTLDTVIEVPLYISNMDKTDLGDNIAEQDIQAAVEAIVDEADLMVIEQLRLSPYYSSIGTPSFAEIQGWLKNTKTRGFPDRAALIDPASSALIFGVSEMHKANERGTGEAMASGQVGYALGMNWYESNNCRMKETPADAALAVNNKGDAYASGATSIAFDTGSNSDLAAGDMVKFGNGTTYYTVQSVTWGVAGTSGTMVINALTATDAALAVDDAAITVKRPNDAFIAAKASVLFGNKPLKKYADPAVTSVTVETEYGSARVVLHADPLTKKEYFLVEFLCGVKIIKPTFVEKIVDLT